MKTIIINAAILLLLCPLLYADNDVIYDSLMTSYIAMNWVDLTLTYAILENGGYEMNPLAKRYVEEPALAVSGIILDNIAVNWGCKQIYKANKAAGIITLIAINLIKGYVIYHNLKVLARE